MVDKAHKSALLVLTDRATLLTKLKKVTSRKAEPMASHIIRQLSAISPACIKTLIFDNDKAFAKHQKMARELQADTHFTRPYTSQGKGTVENRIYVNRRFFPKGLTCIRPQTKASKPLKSISTFSLYDNLIILILFNNR